MCEAATRMLKKVLVDVLVPFGQGLTIEKPYYESHEQGKGCVSYLYRVLEIEDVQC